VLGVVLDLLKKRFRREAGDAAVKAGFAFAALCFALMGVSGLFFALFLALEPSLGALRATLSVSGLALALAVLASAPLWWPRRRPPPPPTLAEFVALMARNSPALTPRQMALGAVLAALALGLMSASKESKE